VAEILTFVQERNQVQVQEKKGEAPELDLLEGSKAGRLEVCASLTRDLEK
jgi:hypothetical protein